MAAEKAQMLKVLELMRQKIYLLIVVVVVVQTMAQGPGMLLIDGR